MKKVKKHPGEAVIRITLDLSVPDYLCLEGRRKKHRQPTKAAFLRQLIRHGTL